MEPQRRVRQARGDTEETEEPRRKRRIRSKGGYLKLGGLAKMSDRCVDFRDFGRLIDSEVCFRSWIMVCKVTDGILMYESSNYVMKMNIDADASNIPLIQLS